VRDHCRDRRFLGGACVRDRNHDGDHEYERPHERAVLTDEEEALRAAFERGVAAGDAQIATLTRQRDEARHEKLHDDGIIQAAREHIERLRGLLRDVAKWLHNRNIATRLIARIDAALGETP